MGRMARVIVTLAVMAISMEILLVAGRIFMPDAGLGALFSTIAVVAVFLGAALWRFLPRDDA